jgi:protein gp37
MGDRSKIEWTDATWNPVTGCSKVSSGCKCCYAERDFHRPYPGREFTDVRVHPERLDQPLRWRKPRKIFVNSMSDLFHERVRDEFIQAVFGVMCAAGQHTFQILTKRPERAREFLRATCLETCLAEMSKQSIKLALANHPRPQDTHAWSNRPWPLPNAWLGVSVEDQERADQRIPVLLATPAAVRFVSYEPALGPVDFSRYLGDPLDEFEESLNSMGFVKSRLDWVIAGGESGANARPSHRAWFRMVRDQCQAAGVAFFFKQSGAWVPYKGDYTDLHLTSSRPTHRMIAGQLMERRGRGHGSRLLDGREWNEFPVVR